MRTGFVDVPREDGGTARLPTFAGWVEAWTPDDTLAERALRDQAPYDVWVEEGWLNAVPGKHVRQDVVAARVAELALELDVECLVYDRYAWRKFEQELDALGVTTPQFEHPQGGIRRAKESGLWMPGSVVELETAILDKRIRLKRSPVLISAMMSAAVERDAFDNRWFSQAPRRQPHRRAGRPGDGRRPGRQGRARLGLRGPRAIGDLAGIGIEDFGHGGGIPDARRRAVPAVIPARAAM